MIKMRPKAVLFGLLGLVFCTVPVVSVILLYFPMWIDRGSATVLSGFSLLLLLMASVPIFKLAKRLLSSPSAPVMWLVAFLLFFMLSRIADDMTVISFVGFIGNIIGTLFFKLAEKFNRKEEDADEG